MRPADGGNNWQAQFVPLSGERSHVLLRKNVRAAVSLDESVCDGTVTESDKRLTEHKQLDYSLLSLIKLSLSLKLGLTLQTPYKLQLYRNLRYGANSNILSGPWALE